MKVRLKQNGDMLRNAALPDRDEQLAALWKIVEALAASNPRVALPAEALAIRDRITAAKSRFPKGLK